MIGATGAANVGEPVTQAGLRAFHGGGKGTVPTTDRIVQMLDLSQSAIKQPVTKFYLSTMSTTMKRHAKILLTSVQLFSLMMLSKLIKYLPEKEESYIVYDAQVIDTFDLDPDFIRDYLAFKGNNHQPKFTVNETDRRLRIRTMGAKIH